MIPKINIRTRIILSTVLAMSLLAAALIVIMLNIIDFLGKTELQHTMRHMAKLAATAAHAKINMSELPAELVNFDTILADSCVSEHSTAYIINSDGNFIAHRDINQALLGESLFEDHPPGSELHRHIKSIFCGQAGSIRIGSGISSMTFGFAPIQGTDLTIIIETPLRYFVDHISGAIFAGILIILALLGLFTLVASALISCFITKPLKTIIQSTHSINRGIFVNQFPAPLMQRQDEIGQLARAFVSMSQSIERVICEIEQIVKGAGAGSLNERMDVSLMEGNFLKIVSGMNSALDLICSHMDAIPVALALFNEKREMLYSNSAMKEFLFMHDLEDCGTELLERIAGSGCFSSNYVLDSRAVAIFDPALTNPAPYTADLTLLGHEGGSNYNMTIQRVGAKTPGNKSTCVMLLLNDFTLLTRAKIDAEQASLAKSDFLSRMSHEIRTPMNAVIGMTEIARRTDDIEKITACLDQIMSSSNHLLGVINDILDFSKMESGKLLLDVTEFSLSADLEFVISMMLPRARQRNISIHLSTNGVENDGLLADSLRLNQVLINLLSNAVKFSPDGSDILLNVRELGTENGISTYTFEVIDYGIGINEYQASKLFMPFEQGASTITRNYGGTGLGLVICKNLVEMMGGKITLESEVGNGSKFTFTIRCASRPKIGIPPDDQTISPNEDDYDFSGKCCLVVDDIEINRAIIVELLSNTNIVLETAENGQEAVDKFVSRGEGYFDLILMDIQMPVMDGYAATEEIRRIEKKWAADDDGEVKEIPIVAMTANVMQDDIQKVARSGMNAHLGKPIELVSTLKTIRKQLDRTPGEIRD